MKNVNYLLRTVVYGAFALVLVLAWFQITGAEERHAVEIAARERRIHELEEDLQAKQLRIDQLETARRFLKTDHRVARIQVLDQTPEEEDPERVHTTLEFQELGFGGEPLGPPAIITLQGRVAYLDALVIKFEDDYVEKGDFLRGTSICLFRRLFGEFQQPNEGFPIDAAGSRPRAYSAEDTDPAFQRDLWKRFWDYANDRALAEELGVRALQGEAPYMELRPGRSYRVELRSSGGLTIRPGP